MATIKKPAGADDQLADYENQLQETTALALAGRIDRRTFEREMLKNSTETTLIMFLTGGGNVKDPDAKKWLTKQKAIHRKSVKAFAEDIYSGRYSDETGEDV